MGLRMAQGDPLGKLSLLIIVLIVFYDTIFGLLKVATNMITDAFNEFFNLIDNMIIIYGGGSPIFPNTEDLLQSLFSWETFVFSNAMALAIVIFIDVIKTAYRG